MSPETDQVTYGERIRRLTDALDPADAVAYARLMAEISAVAARAVEHALDDIADGRSAIAD